MHDDITVSAEPKNINNTFCESIYSKRVRNMMFQTPYTFSCNSIKSLEICYIKLYTLPGIILIQHLTGNFELPEVGLKDTTN